MIDLLVRGGLWFTLPLTGIALGTVAAAVWAGMRYRSEPRDGAFWKHAVLRLGLLGLVVGLFGLMVSLYEAMIAIEGAGSVSPALLAGGLRVALIVPTYGLGVCTGALLCWLGLHLAFRSAVQAEGTP